MGKRRKKPQVLKPWTRKLCEGSARVQATRDLARCNIDHTDPANAKCYHDAHKKYVKNMNDCKKIPPQKKP